MPISLHILTGRRGTGVDTRHVLRSYMSLPHSIQVSFAELVLGGVLERYPRLKLVSAENDISWMPHFCYRLDHAYDRLRHLDTVQLSLRPSDYMKRQVYGTFQFETENVGFTCEKYGADRLMWSSDYPHTDSPWPRSKEFIAQWIDTIDEAEKYKVIGGNAAELYQVS
jgi:predicted TIM-barrel fold metal-dependent hydrolase